MKERPIIFSAPMVRAILDGRKTQTRRIVKPQPTVEIEPQSNYQEMVRGAGLDCCRHGVTGDRLWVREAFYHIGETRQVFYKADGSNNYQDDLRWGGPWKPSIHMPRWASRITLEITDIRVERLQDISEKDALADGGWEYKKCPVHCSPKMSFADLWQSIYGHGSWDANPWVWVVSFRKLDA